MNLKLRYYTRLFKAFIIRFNGIIIIGIVLGFIFFLTINYILPIFMNRKVEVMGLQGKYHSDRLPVDIQMLISDGLTKINSKGIPEPNIAESWETIDKGKTWIFKIKPNIYWQDGEKLTTAEINYNFSDVEVERPDDITIIFKLKDPYSPFPTVVSKPIFKKGLLGTGNWKVDKIKISGSFVQELKIKRENDISIYKFYPTEEQLKTSFKLGHVKKIINLTSLNPFQEWNTLKIDNLIKEDKVVVLFFNTQDKWLSEKSLRQALAYAIDKNELSENRAISSINPNSWAYNPQAKKYSYNPQNSKDLIDKLPKELKKDLSINLVSSPNLIELSENISKYWTDVGIKTQVQVSSIIPNEFQAYLTILDIPNDPDQYPLWHSTQTSTNISNYSSPRIDKLLEDGRSSIDSDERKKIYLDFQRFLVEDTPAVFLYHPTFYNIEKK